MSKPVKCIQCGHQKFTGPYLIPSTSQMYYTSLELPGAGYWVRDKHLARLAGFVCLNCGHVAVYVTKQGLQNIHQAITTTSPATQEKLIASQPSPPSATPINEQILDAFANNPVYLIFLMILMGVIAIIYISLPLLPYI